MNSIGGCLKWISIGKISTGLYYKESKSYTTLSAGILSLLFGIFIISLCVFTMLTPSIHTSIEAI
jgi:hypothetical protein